MNYTVNNQLRTSILFDGTAEARLADILAMEEVELKIASFSYSAA